jgi:hypothetical protein
MTKIAAIGTEIKATDIKAGMTVKIYGGSEQIAVTRATANRYGSVTITDGIRTRGLGANESVTVTGYFNL